MDNLCLEELRHEQFVGQNERHMTEIIQMRNTCHQ
jgi:hypothetical protein